MNVIQWVLGQLNVKENAPRWAGLLVAAVATWLAGSGINLDPGIQAAAVLIVTVAITTIVQKVATLPRSTD